MSGRRRFFTDRIDPETSLAVLQGEEFVHARTVQRVREGSEICLLDGSGREYTAIVVKIEKNSLTAHVTGFSESDREPQTPVYLLAGGLKGDKTELIVQKSCELGVGKVGIFSSEFSSAYFNENKLDRLKKVAREAAKQCMRASVPEIEYFPDFSSALASAEGYENKFFACEFGERTEKKLFPLKGSTAVVVGSEGGFSQAEYGLAKRAGFSVVYLGKRILRAETACIALLSVISYALGELR